MHLKLLLLTTALVSMGVGAAGTTMFQTRTIVTATCGRAPADASDKAWLKHFLDVPPLRLTNTPKY